MVQQELFSLFLKLAVAASLASILIRSRHFQRVLLVEQRTLRQRMQLAAIFIGVFGASAAIRIITGVYQAADLSVEGSLMAGLLGGYVTGIVSGILIAMPAMLHQEWLALPLCAGVGVLGGLLRDLAPDPEDIWRFTLFPDLGLLRVLRERNPTQNAFHLGFLLAILLAEFARQGLGTLFDGRFLFLLTRDARPSPLEPALQASVYAATLLCITVPIKIWNSFRTEAKLAAQQRLLQEARLEALTSQINPHFLFNTLTTISSLVRLNPEQARTTILQLSRILRRLLRKHENLSPLRDELSFIDDYLAIEVVRFGDKLRFVKEIEAGTLDHPVPSMLLQPIVENSIRHGLSGKVDGGMIRIRSWLENNRLHVLVEDDGVGIPDNRLETLFTQGIGISNVNERLKVLFGDEYRMWIDSKPGEGTRTGFEIPRAAVLPAAS